MKLNGRDAERFADRPDRAMAGALIWGDDGVAVAERRDRLCEAWLGDGEGAELRRTAMPAANARRDVAMIVDAMKSTGFFSGPQVVLVEDATDAATAAISAALAAARSDDGFLLVSAGSLTARSSLRKLFEGARNAVALPCYEEPLDREAIRRSLSEQGVGEINDTILAEIETIARGLERGAARDFLVRLALYKLSDPSEINEADILAMAPDHGDDDVNALLGAVLEGRAGDIGRLLQRLEAQGQAATGVTIAAGRQFRQMHKVLATASGSALEDAAARQRPPVFGPQRNMLVRACRKWGVDRVEDAMRQVLETDMALRGAAGAAGYAVLSRALIRLTLIGARPR